VAQPKKPHVPWGILLKNRSFWGVALGGFGHIWTIQFFVFWLPYYLQAAKGLSFRDMGYFTSVPWIFIVAAVFTTGTFSDFLLKKGLPRFWARNMVSVAGLVLAAIALIISTHADDPVANILWLSLALGFVGVAQTLMWAMMTEIGQQLTSIVSSWMNAWGFIAATIVPAVAPLVARDYGWNQVLILNACVMVIAIVGFLMINTQKPLHTPE
jgi:ACS family glucarate transporter-like MFS transporter